MLWHVVVVSFIRCVSLVVETCGGFHVLAIPKSPDLANYTTSVVDNGSGAAAVWHIFATALAKMALTPFFHPSERSLVGSQFFDPRMGQGVWWVLTPLYPGLSGCVYHYLSASFVFDCPSDSAGANLVYCGSAEIDWLFLDDMWCWLPYCFARGHVHDFLELVATARMEVQVERLFQMECMLFGSSSRWHLLLSGAAWLALSFRWAGFPQWMRGFLIPLRICGAFLMNKMLM